MDALLTKFVQGDDEAKEALKANPFEENQEMMLFWGIRYIGLSNNPLDRGIRSESKPPPNQ